MDAFRARPQLSIRLEIPFAGVDVDDQEDAAEQIEQLIELLEYLLEEKIVGLHHEDGTGGTAAEFSRERGVAEVHAAIQAGSIDEHRARFLQARDRQLYVDAAD